MAKKKNKDDAHEEETPEEGTAKLTEEQQAELKSATLRFDPNDPRDAALHNLLPDTYHNQ